MTGMADPRVDDATLEPVGDQPFVGAAA